jgi:hypothetical protein
MSNNLSGGEILSQVTIFSKYARHLPHLNRRENWDEIVDRTLSMHCRKYPKLEEEIIEVFNNYVRPKLVLPSMRSLQFAGKPIELFSNRIHNCCALPIDNTKAFREIMFLLMGGTGVGYSVQYNHVKKLPAIKKPIGRMRYIVQDSIIGWSEAVDMLMKAYFYGERTPEFDFGDIRPRGTLLKTSGGRAPGPEELAKSLESIRAILETVSYGDKLTSIQCHDICCHIAAAVLSGGVRRAAMISLFDFDDEEMLSAKTDDWLSVYPNRQYANNSAMALRYKLRKKDLTECIERIHQSGFGEPGLCLANDYNSLYNPCFGGETLIATREGHYRIKDLVGQVAEVWDGEQWVKIDSFRVTARNQKMLVVILHNREVVRTTEYHPFILEDGTRVEAKDLNIGDKLKTHSQGIKVYNKIYNWNTVEYILEQDNLEPEVYCCTVPTNHKIGLSNSILTFQCSEASVSLNFCNLSTFNMSVIESNQDLIEFAKAAAFIGTLQAGYTNFVYLRPVWQEKTEEEALLGVSCTGVARKDLTDFDFQTAAEEVKKTNRKTAKKIGIRPAYRTTANKPEGSSSAVLNTSSGIHAWHSQYGIRRTRYMYDEPIIKYFEQIVPDLVETDKSDSKRRVLSLPFCAPENAITRDQESALELLERVRFMSLNWVKPGHIKGHNGHSVSATVSVKGNEWNEVAEWMWKNRNDYNGISILPYDGGQYKQAPFEEISKEQYENMVQLLPENIDLNKVKETEDNTTHHHEVSCTNGACQID